LRRSYDCCGQLVGAILAPVHRPRLLPGYHSQPASIRGKVDVGRIVPVRQAGAEVTNLLDHAGGGGGADVASASARRPMKSPFSHRYCVEGKLRKFNGIRIGIKLTEPDFVAVLEGKLAGAEGFEPSPSTLTVWCPTGWTTPQLELRPTTSNELGRLRRNGRDGGFF
jgi:hypothetical protein